MRTLSSDELNFLIYRYLQESGFKHSAFTFAHESLVNKANLKNAADVPPGSLISFVQKGIQYLEIEAKLKSKDFEETGGNVEIKYSSPFELLLPNSLKTKIHKSKHSERKTKKAQSAKNAASFNNPPSAASSSNTGRQTRNSQSSATFYTSKSPEPTDPKSSTTTNKVKQTNKKAKPKANDGGPSSATASSTSKTSESIPSGISTTTTTMNSLTQQQQQQQQNLSSAKPTHKASNNSNTIKSNKMEIEEEPTQVNAPEDTSLLIPNSDVQILKGHTHEVFICAWSPTNSHVLASGSGDATARIWELPQKDEIGNPMSDLNTIVLKHADEENLANLNNKDIMTSKDVTTLDWSGDGRMLATGSYDGIARIWTNKGQLMCALEMHKGPIFSLKWNKRGDYLLSGSVDNTAIIWDIATATVKQKFVNHTAPTLDVDWRTDTSFATCSTDKMIYVCKLGENKPLRVFKGHADEVNAIRWDPSGSLLASCSDDFTAKIWSMKSDRCIFDFRDHTKEIYTIKWSPTGPGTAYPNKDLVLASASFDASIKIWDVNVGKCLHSLTKHTDPVYSVAFSPDGEYLASGSFDRNLHIWSVKDGKLVRTYKGNGSIFEVCWNSDGDKVAACFSNSYCSHFSVCVCDFRK